MDVSGIKAILKNRLHREKVYCTAEYWNRRAAAYKGYAVSMWLNNNLNHYYHHEQLAVIHNYLPDVKGKHILDVGCGTGRLSRYLAERGANVLGIDFSAKVIEIAKNQTLGDSPYYRVESIFNLDEKNAFDIVVVSGVVCVACKNQTELLDVMSRLRKSLKPQGRLLLWEPIHQGFFHRVLNMDIWQFKEVMVKAGFKIEDSINLHFLPVRLALSYLPWPKFITTLGYYLGNWVMELLGNKAWGDYKVIYASVC